MVKGKYRKAVFLVVYRRHNSFLFGERIKYLLLKRHKHWVGWEFPKGGIETKESIEDAIKRELWEECGQEGFNLKKHNARGKYKYSKKIAARPGIIGQTYTLFSIEVKDKNVKIDKREHSGYLWASFEKCMAKLTHGNQRKSLTIVNDYLKKQ